MRENQTYHEVVISDDEADSLATAALHDLYDRTKEDIAKKQAENIGLLLLLRAHVLDADIKTEITNFIHGLFPDAELREADPSNLTHYQDLKIKRWREKAPVFKMGKVSTNELTS